MKGIDNIGPVDKKYYYAHGLIMYIYNKNDEALKSWQEFLNIEKKNSEVIQYKNDLKNSQVSN